MTGNEARPQVLTHLGPYAKHQPVATLFDLDERVWARFHELAGGHECEGETSHHYLIIRMLYIAEVTSTAIRLNASWALTHAAMSLLRDRYEQAVRFSWLVRNPDKTEFHKYERAIFAKINSIVQSIDDHTRKHYEDLMGPTPPWAAERMTKDQRAYLDAWGTLDLKSMATKRDAFPPLAETVLAKESLAHWYNSIYAQFSSVAHYDRYSMEMLHLYPAPNGQLVLAAQPHWPSMLTLQNTYFDIIQCFEAAFLYHTEAAATIFEWLLTEWLAISKQVTPR
jgi:hypothetical protein